MSNDFAQTVVVFCRDGLGDAEEALRHKLAKNYLRTLLELGQQPRTVVFYASGVKLVERGSPCLAELAELAASGVSLIACRTCLEYYGLTDRVGVGDIGNMVQIVEAQAQAAKVVTV